MEDPAGKKQCGAKKAYKARFKTVYQPGELTAGRTEEYFYRTTRSACEGRALAIVRAGYRAGKITVKISAGGFESKEVEIKVILCSL